MIQKSTLKQFICLLVILMLTGCGTTEQLSNGEDGLSANEIASSDTVSENVSSDSVSVNKSQSAEDISVIELQDGLYAYITTEISADIELDGITEWIAIQNCDPRECEFARFSGVDRQILIPNVYGTIMDIQGGATSGFTICYKDSDGENLESIVPIDFYAADSNAIEPFRWESVRALFYNEEELKNEDADFVMEVWSETFASNGKDYTATYSRISPIYGRDWVEGQICLADYQLIIRSGEEIVYEVKLYGMAVQYEEVHIMEDVNSDGIKDIIQMTNDSVNTLFSFPYVFVWDTDKENCILAGTIKTEEMSSYESVSHTPVPLYETILYDRDSGIFYDVNAVVRHDYNHRDIHDLFIVFGAKVINGEWRTVYELYLGEEGEDYAREIKYDEEGNVISEIICTEEEHYDLVREIYDICELKLYDNFLLYYDEERIIVNELFSYWKYVRKEVETEAEK